MTLDGKVNLCQKFPLLTEPTSAAAPLHLLPICLVFPSSSSSLLKIVGGN